MTSKPSNQPDESQIIAYLADKQGDARRVCDIAAYFKASTAALRAKLVQMSSNNLIRSGYSGGKVGYYLPTDEQLAGERELMQRTSPAWTPEHKVSKERRELYEKLAAERSVYASIG